MRVQALLLSLCWAANAAVITQSATCNIETIEGNILSASGSNGCEITGSDEGYPESRSRIDAIYTTDGMTADIRVSSSAEALWSGSVGREVDRILGASTDAQFTLTGTVYTYGPPRPGIIAYDYGLRVSSIDPSCGFSLFSFGSLDGPPVNNCGYVGGDIGIDDQDFVGVPFDLGVPIPFYISVGSSVGLDLAGRSFVPRAAAVAQFQLWLSLFEADGVTPVAVFADPQAGPILTPEPSSASLVGCAVLLWFGAKRAVRWRQDLSSRLFFFCKSVMRCVIQLALE
jgi:hypothetical protein